MLGSRPSDSLLQSALQFRYGFLLTPRILVVEGDRDLAREIGHHLERVGYDVLPCATGGEALDVIDQIGLPNLAVVNVRLPDMDGLAFCRRVRHFSDLPIVLLSSSSGSEEVAAALLECADDYVARPFKPHDLVVRIQRALNQIGAGLVVAPLVQVDDHLAVDFVHQQALVGGRPVPITPLESKILHILMQRAGSVVSDDYLRQRLGVASGPRRGNGDTLRDHLDDLRRKIEPDPAQPYYLREVPHAGYCFAQ